MRYAQRHSSPGSQRRDAEPGSNGCTVLTGTLADPYTGTKIAFTRGVGTSTEVQIDHMVALSNAWQTGAQQLSEAQRVNLANDPRNLQATQGRANEQKSDGDAATWLPSNKSYRCTMRLGRSRSSPPTDCGSPRQRRRQWSESCPPADRPRPPP